jgi:hypothetical protein
MRGAIPPLPIRLHGVVLSYTQGQIFYFTVNENNLLHAGQFGFCACHGTTLQCMSLTDHVTLNLNSYVYGCGILGYGKNL